MCLHASPSQDVWFGLCSQDLHHYQTEQCIHHDLLCRLGVLDPRPAYCTETQLWPIGYWARASIPEDLSKSYLLSKISQGGDEGPLFTISSKLPYGSSAEEPVVSLCYLSPSR